jgi:hypothetical protein
MSPAPVRSAAALPNLFTHSRANINLSMLVLPGDAFLDQ